MTATSHGGDDDRAGAFVCGDCGRCTDAPRVESGLGRATRLCAYVAAILALAIGVFVRWPPGEGLPALLAFWLGRHALGVFGVLLGGVVIAFAIGARWGRPRRCEHCGGGRLSARRGA